MTLDERSLRHIISLLTDLYSDPVLACIREYSTNARDSHIEAGQTRPIEIWTPTPLLQVFRVVDYGIGLDAEAIRTIYSKYGASTKRETDDLSGVLGLGCKSALTYASQFTVKGIKDGVRTVISISRKQDGGGVQTILDESKTDEPNGVEISIPVKKVNDFEAKAHYFFKFWEKGMVLIDGEEPKPLDGSLLDSETKMMITKDAHTHTVVMGGVPYPIDREKYKFDAIRNDRTVVAWVDMGEVEFTPSREALQYDKRTTAKLDAIVNDFNLNMTKMVQDDIDSANSGVEAIQKYHNWKGILSIMPSLAYRGQVIPQRFGIRGKPGEPATTNHQGIYISPGNDREVLTTARSFRHGGYYRPGKAEHQKLWEIDSEAALERLFVEGYTPLKFTAGHKDKLNKYLEEKGLNLAGFVLSSSPMTPAKDWLYPRQFAKWEDIKAIKLEPKLNANGTRRLSGSYDIYVGAEEQREIPADKIDTSKKLIYHPRSSRSFAPSMAKVFDEIYPGCVIVDLTANRIEKFKRDFPMAVAFSQAANEAVEKVFKGIPKDDLHARVFQSARYLPLLDPKKIEDPELKRAVRLARKKTLSPKVAQVVAMSRLLGMGSISGKLDVKVDNPLAKYPLVGASYQVHDHTYTYVNHIYALRAEGQKI